MEEIAKTRQQDENEVGGELFPKTTTETEAKPKKRNSIYDTFLGGYDGWLSPDGSRPHNSYSYTFWWGRMRFTKNYAYRLNVEGSHYSFHYRNTKFHIYTDSHVAFIKKFPYILLGFKAQKPYIND